MGSAEKLDALIDGAEELLTRLADVHSPEIQRLRERVDHAVRDTRRTIARQADNPSRQLSDVARAVNDYVQDYPWLAVVTGILVAGTVAYIAGTALGNRNR